MRRVFAVLIAALFVACGKTYSEDTSTSSDAGADVLVTPIIDSGPDPTPDAEATIDAGPDAAPAGSGLYYVACLSELAFNQVSKVFNFYVKADVSNGEQLTLKISSLAVENAKPPATFTKNGTVGTEIPTTATLDQTTGHYPLSLATLTIPGAANPISGSDVVVENTVLSVRRTTKFCGRLAGNIVAPAAAARTLDPAKNICQFVALEDGAKTPTFVPADFLAPACP